MTSEFPFLTGARDLLVSGKFGIKGLAGEVFSFPPTDFSYDLKRQAITFVEAEGSRRVNGGELFKFTHPSCHGFCELVTLALEFGADGFALPHELRVGSGVGLDDFVEQGVGEVRGQGMDFFVDHHPAHEPPEHIAGFLVGRPQPIGEKKGNGTDVIGDDALCPNRQPIGQECHEREEEIGLENV